MDIASGLDFRAHAEHDGITHISTGIAVLRSNKILMVRRTTGDYLGGYYELPGGGVDEGETIEDGALRELKEETGLVASKVLGMFEGFDYSTGKKPKVRQVNFLVEAANNEIILDPNEHDAYEWIDCEMIMTIQTTPIMIVCVRNALTMARSH